MADHQDSVGSTNIDAARGATGRERVKEREGEKKKMAYQEGKPKHCEGCLETRVTFSLQLVYLFVRVRVPSNLLKVCTVTQWWNAAEAERPVSAR